MPEFKEPTKEFLSDQSFKNLFDACLFSGDDPVEYAKKNNIDMNSAEFFKGLREWSTATANKRDYKEDMLLYKITQNSAKCCHIDCGGPTCSRAMFDKILQKEHPLPEQKLEILTEAIKSKSIFDFAKPRIIEDLLLELFKNQLSSEIRPRILEELNSIRKFITENGDHQNPYVLRDLEKLAKTVDEYEQKLASLKEE